MRTSARGIDMIVRFEGLVPHAYTDPAGHATFGVGHLLHFGPCTARDLALWGSKLFPKVDGRERALRVLREDLRPRERAVRRLVKVPLNQCEYDALVSLLFNIGEGNFAASTVLRELNKGHRYRAGLAFLMWDRAGGRVLLGLSRRRRAERKLFRKRCGRRLAV